MTDKLGTTVRNGDYVITPGGVLHQLTSHSIGLRWHAERIFDKQYVGIWIDLCYRISPEEAMFLILKG